MAADPRLNEDLALALLNRRDLPREVLEDLSKNAVAQHRKVQLAVAMHPRSPRHVSIPIIRRLYTFELMQMALFPAVAADVKMAAEETLIGRLKTISSGERFALAKQSSGRVAAALLLDPEERIMRAALLNPRMTELLIAKALKAEEASAVFVAAVSHHEKWSRRNDIKMALLAQEHTPFAKILQFAQELPARMLRDALLNSRLKPNVKSYLRALVEQRGRSQARRGD